jgi:3-oxoacyl-[acyl-carrier protein] reductase
MNSPDANPRDAIPADAVPPEAVPASAAAGPVVAITGAGRGLGLLVARTLLEQGAMVAANHRSDSPELAELAEKHSGRLVTVAGDIGEEAAAEELVAAAREFGGRLDALVHNAAVTRDGPLVRMSVEDWDEVLRVGLRGGFLAAKHALRPMMRQRSGRMVFLSSIAATLGNSGQAAYAAAKTGLEGLAKSIAQEYAAYGIRAVVLAPGLLDVGLGVRIDAERQDHLAARSLAGRGAAERVAELVAVLTGPAAELVNGSVVRADGGIRF